MFILGRMHYRTISYIWGAFCLIPFVISIVSLIFKSLTYRKYSLLDYTSDSHKNNEAHWLFTIIFFTFFWSYLLYLYLIQLWIIHVILCTPSSTPSRLYQILSPFLRSQSRKLLSRRKLKVKKKRKRSNQRSEEGRGLRQEV